MSVDMSAGEGGRGPTVSGDNLLVRIASATLLLAIAILAAYLGGVVAGVVVAIFAVIVQFEWANVTGASTRRTVPLALAVGIAVVAAGFGMVAAAALIALAAAIFAAAFDRGAWLAGGVIYASALGISLVALRVAPEFGFAAVVFVLAIVWATDSGAFFAGRTIGGIKLWPRISPKKTWAGAIGGLLAGAAAGLVAAWLTGIPVTRELMTIAVTLSVFCQIGDLYESWVKRRFGAKDSGNLIPGHGGVMDRVDGLTFAAAAAVAIGAGHAGPAGLGRGLLIW